MSGPQGAPAAQRAQVSDWVGTNGTQRGRPSEGTPPLQQDPELSLERAQGPGCLPGRNSTVGMVRTLPGSRESLPGRSTHHVIDLVHGLGRCCSTEPAGSKSESLGKALLSSLLPSSTLCIHMGTGSSGKGKGDSPCLASLQPQHPLLGSLCPCPARTGTPPQSRTLMALGLQPLRAGHGPGVRGLGQWFKCPPSQALPSRDQ